MRITSVKRVFPCLLLTILLTACTTQPTSIVVGETATFFNPPQLTDTPELTSTPEITSTPIPLVPPFEHIAIVIFENEGYENVIGNPEMPVFNRLAQEYTLLTNYFAVQHPSLPNYIALIGGNTFGITSDCTGCFIGATSLPDLIEASGRSWKTYQEDMPGPCYVGSDAPYAQKHNPFVYFDPIRLDTERCQRNVVPFNELASDIAAGTLPNYMFITPNLCNDAHDCGLDVADQWLANLFAQLDPALEASGEPYLLILDFDERGGRSSSSNDPNAAGGQVAAVLVSPQVKTGFQDNTFYTHYSILKTISAAWDLEFLGHAGDIGTAMITSPWK